MEQKNRTLVIEIPYGGFGDHLFHSHLPRIAKETSLYDVVLFSTKSLIRQQDHLDLVWKLNPFIDGFVEENGVCCDLKQIVDSVPSDGSCNLLDLVMLAYSLDDGKRWHDPELYYQPKLIPAYQKKIFDPNHFTYIGDFNVNDLYAFFKRNNIEFDAILKLRGNKSLYIYERNHDVIDAPNVYDFCNVLFSAKEIHCFTSGTATLSVALKKNAIVYYGENINRGFHHSKNNKYLFIKKTVFHLFIDACKRIIKKYSIKNVFRRE